MLNNCNHNDYYQVDIDTPLLEALIYDDHVATYYWGMQLNSLLRAYIDVGPSDSWWRMQMMMKMCWILRDVEFSICSSLPIEKQYSTWPKLSSLQGCSKSKNCIDETVEMMLLKPEEVLKIIKLPEEATSPAGETRHR
ncbi:hypothetical protein RHMOL_Rhmol06G0295200 [Rhododendron molle]|uniref:Uncharacterized protein n=1 Tax=Rhododendron molle TaxID=49168 RepID=A0ACC0NJX6_RHOML|nr:hypothetical protein RHMOL_Rhmol06G0295200 [Rhododendron molle]